MSLNGLSATVTFTVECPEPCHSSEDSSGWPDQDKVCTSVKIYYKQFIQNTIVDDIKRAYESMIYFVFKIFFLKNIFIFCEIS